MTKEATPRRLFIIVPQPALTIFDNWNVFALSGTGSNDIALTDYFVPSHMAFWEEKRMRGGPQHRQRGLVASSYEHTGIAIGIARRALREAAEALAGRPSPREMHFNQFGRLQVQLDAITSLVLERLARDYDDLSDPMVDPETVGIANLAMSAHATELARDCVEFAYRVAGAQGLYRPNIFERLLRDVHGATQHVGVQDSHYTDFGARVVAGQ
jgi:alkylation response protein AidB-like acyl-CoA dehydrogenase